MKTEPKQRGQTITEWFSSCARNVQHILAPEMKRYARGAPAHEPFTLTDQQLEEWRRDGEETTP